MRLAQQLDAPPAAQPHAATVAAPATVPAAAHGLQVAGSLVAVVLLIVGLAWLARRLRVLPSASQHLRVVSALTLGARERLLVVEAEGRRLLLSSSAAGLQLVHDLGPAEETTRQTDAGDKPPRLLRPVRHAAGS